MLNALLTIGRRLRVRGEFLQVPVKLFNNHYTFYSSKVIPFNLADIGEGIAQVEILQWYVRENQKIQQFEKIAEVQSDKATVEITSRYDGIIKKLHYGTGDIADVGKPLVDIQVIDNSMEKESSLDNVSHSPSHDTSNSDNKKKENQKEKEKFPKKTLNESKHDKSLSNSNIKIMPAVRVYAKQHGINLDQVKGTGPNGSVTMEDLKKISNRKDSSTLIPSPLSLPYKKIPLGIFQQAMVKSMTKALEIPHFTYGEELDISSLEKIKERIRNENPSLVKITILPIIMKIISDALINYPILNGHYVDGELREWKSHNISIAMDTPTGLSVPVIHNVQSKSIISIANELLNLAQLATKNKLSKDQLSKGTISISNIGSIGGTMAIPVIPPPQLAIIALGKVRILPRYIADKNNPINLSLVPIPIMPLNISADHRIVDGATIAKFVKSIQELIINANY